MSAKEYLKKYDWLCANIKSKELDYQESLTIATSISAPTDGEKVSSSKLSDRTAKAGIDLAERKNELDELKLKAEGMKHIINLMIDRLEPNINYLQVISLRWLRHKKWEDIAEEMGYSLRQAQRIHGFALKELDIIYKDVIECHTHNKI